MGAEIAAVEIWREALLACPLRALEFESRLRNDRRNPSREDVRDGATDPLVAVCVDEGAYELMLVDGRWLLVPLLENVCRLDDDTTTSAPAPAAEASLSSPRAVPPNPNRLARLVFFLSALAGSAWTAVLPRPSLSRKVRSPFAVENPTERPPRSLETWRFVRTRSPAGLPRAPSTRTSESVDEPENFDPSSSSGGTRREFRSGNVPARAGTWRRFCAAPEMVAAAGWVVCSASRFDAETGRRAATGISRGGEGTRAIGGLILRCLRADSRSRAGGRGLASRSRFGLKRRSGGEGESAAPGRAAACESVRHSEASVDSAAALAALLAKDEGRSKWTEPRCRNGTDRRVS